MDIWRDVGKILTRNEIKYTPNNEYVADLIATRNWNVACLRDAYVALYTGNQSACIDKLREGLRLQGELPDAHDHASGATIKSFDVICDETNNSPDSIKQGWLRADVNYKKEVKS